MSYSFNELLKAASEKFPMFELTFSEVKYQGILPIFIARVKCDEQTLDLQWRNLVSHIAFNFQSQMSDDFSVWNVYVFFVTETSIDRSLKYKIENDTFSSRKIVIEENASQEEIISQHITNLDVNFAVVNLTNSASLVVDPIVGKYISMSTVNKRLTEDHRSSLKSIIRELKELAKNEI